MNKYFLFNYYLINITFIFKIYFYKIGTTQMKLFTNNLFKTTTLISVLSGLLLISNPALAKREYKTTIWADPAKGDIFLDEETRPNFDLRDGAEGTYWVWRWQKNDKPLGVIGEILTILDNAVGAYHFSAVCRIATNNCRFIFPGKLIENFNTQRDISVKTTFAYGHLQKLLNKRFNYQSKSEKMVFDINNNITVDRNKHVYGGVIALTKLIVSADVSGMWLGTGNYKKIMGESFRQYIWDNHTVIAKWTGNLLTHHLHFRCVSKTALIEPFNPEVGAPLSKDCSAIPNIPYPSIDTPQIKPPVISNSDYWDRRQ